MSELFKKLPIAEKCWVSHENPDDYTPDSTKVLRWKCECGKRFERAICDLENDHECSNCKKEKTRLTNHPELLKMWDYSKNKEDPHDISIKSDTGYWFVCEEGHSFLRKMRTLAKDPKCPICNMDTIAKNPEMLKFWDYEANSHIDIYTTSSNSSETVWWKCPNCGYRWQAEIATRKMSKNHCPCCEEKTVVMPGFNDFFTVYPELKQDFNDTYDPSLEGVSSCRPTKWKCHECGYEWETYLSSRVVNDRITKCPVCAKRKRVKPYVEEYPELQELYSSNNKVPLTDIIDGKELNNKFLWNCPVHGEFEQTIATIIRSINTKSRGCPYCAGKKVKYEESFGYNHPELVEEYAPTNKYDIYNVTKCSSLEVLWKCKNCGNEWPTTFYERHQGFGKCPVCFPNPTYKRMLYEERPDLEHYYRGSRNFKTFSFQSNERVQWQCDEGHTFDLEVFRMVKDHDTFYCPVCAEKRLVVGVNDFASNYPDLAKEISPNNERHPEEYYKSSVLRVKWLCPECGHEYIASINERIDGKSCPACEGRRTVQGINDLATTHPKLASEYAARNPKPVNSVRKELDLPVWWKCSKCGGEFFRNVNERKDDDCPYCSGKKVLAGFNDLKTLKPTIYDRVAKSYKEVYPVIQYKAEKSLLWECPICHGEYTDTIENIENSINNCPFCAGEKLLSGFNDLKAMYPELEEEWSRENPPIETVSPKYKIAYKWICKECGGEHRASISDHLNGADTCPYCSNKKALKGFNDINTTHPDVTKEWGIENYLLGNGAPEEYTFKNKKSVWWICSVCGEPYKMPIDDRIIAAKRNHKACPKCKGKLKNNIKFVV